MPSTFFQRFRRITYSTAYLPQIDGLRFLAIFSVVVIMHTTHFLDEKFYGNQLIGNSYWKKFVFEGGTGVPLFFIISGFILSLPFAKWRLNNEKPVKLRNYFLRRVTRLEPPYIIALSILFVAHVWWLHKYSFGDLLPHYLASVFYIHTLVYHSFSWVLPVAWSLEVEVQFYILAPLFFLLFLIPNAVLRRAIYLVIIIGGSLFWYNVWTASHVFMYLHYFFLGILATDLYSRQVVLIHNLRAGVVVGLCALAGYIFLPSFDSFAAYLLKIACMFLLLHTALSNDVIKKLLSAKAIVLIGGMCYSIYLLHYAVISFVGQELLKSGIHTANISSFPLFASILIVAVLLVSSCFYLLVERPFMKPSASLKKKQIESETAVRSAAN
jgi:peptidoglycan/LPS O-acetylase OafA/YrhL